MIDVDYSKQKFSFRTVFHKTAYSYCCCSCGFEHEFLDYISDTGEILEEIYEKIVQCIINGECPHAVYAAKEDITETRVYGIHIAAAAGTEQAVKIYLSHEDVTETGIFHLRPSNLALIKQKYSVADLLYRREEYPNLFEDFYEAEDTYLYISRVNEQLNHICVEQESVLTKCVRERNIQLLKTVLSKFGEHSGLEETFAFTLKHEVTDLQEIMMEYIKLDRRTRCYKLGFIQSAILYNRPIILGRLLKYLFKYPSSSSAFTSFIKRKLYNFRELCCLLKRWDCKFVFSIYGIFQQSMMSVEDRVVMLANLLENVYTEFKDEIITALTHVLTVETDLSSNYPQEAVKRQLELPRHTLQVLLRIGADVNNTDTHGDTPLAQLLNINHYIMYKSMKYREAMEFIIYENPDLELHTSAVSLGLKQDECGIQQLFISANLLSIHYQTDTKKRGLFGYDDINNFALNFAGPFLMECGFPVMRHEIIEYLSKQLHPAEHLYLQTFLDTPRPLTMICRMTLRQHFKGWKIHKFVETLNCPQKIKEFILMKHLLRPKTCKYKYN